MADRGFKNFKRVNHNMKITICGGGNGAHTVAGVTSLAEGFEVTVLDIYQDESERWNRVLAKHGFCVNFSEEKKLTQSAGHVRFSVTKNPEVVQASDIVIICVPAYAHEIYLKTVVPYLSDTCTVVGMPGQPGYEYQCLFHLRKHGKQCNIKSLETLPWACRIIDYGREVKVVGTKHKVDMFFAQRNEKVTEDIISVLQQALGNRPVLNRLSHMLILTLATKASIHPPIMYAKWKGWDGKALDSPPLFYQGVDEEAAEMLDTVTNEIITISSAVKAGYPNLDFSSLASMNDWLIDHYGDMVEDKSTLLSSLRTNRAFDGLKHPMTRTNDGKFLPDFGYRYTTEDVPYGLVVLKAIAELVDVKTPRVDEIIKWAQERVGREFLVDAKISFKDAAFARLPQTYGIGSLEDLVNLFE